MGIEGGDKINVSRRALREELSELLRAELLSLKLDLIDRLASRSEVVELEKRVHNAEQDIRLINEARAARQHLQADVIKLSERFSNFQIRVYVIAALLGGGTGLAGNYFL